MKKIITTIGFLISVQCFLFAQQETQRAGNWCGTQDLETITQRLFENKAYSQAHSHDVQARNAIKYVPLRFHLVADASGNGRVYEKSVFDLVCSMNVDYEPMGIQFYVKDFSKIDNNNVNDNPGSDAANFIMNSKRDYAAINIFVCKNASTSNSNSIGQTLAYYNPSTDWLVMRSDQVSSDASTVSHEVGHFFSLLHPFNGWDYDNYTVRQYGQKVGIYAPGNSLKTPYGRVKNECMNKSNCNEAGDYVCDTPPDYNFGFGWDVGGNKCAQYTNIVLDPCGDTIKTQENNMMAYFIGCKKYQFTPQQQALITADYASRRRDYIRSGASYVPNTVSIGGATTILTPSAEQIVSYLNVPFDWSDVANASYYLVEIDITRNFSYAPQTFVVNNSFMSLPALNKNASYYWRVTAFNDGGYCNLPTSAITHFRTNDLTAVQEVEQVDAWLLSPNPVTADANLDLNIAAKQGFEAQIKIYSMLGQVVKNFGTYNINEGANTFSVSPAGLAKGLYILTLETDKGLMNKKIVIE